MYSEYDHLNLPKIDQAILEFWEKEEIFDKSVEGRDPDNAFVFYEGPPSANGKPGIHHVMARAIKDIICRYHSMKGKRVERKGGWDTHGLPVELQVEKELGITKDDIGNKISVAAYNAHCRETVMKYKSVWDDLTVKMGYWVDLDDPYITFKNEYIETVWYLLKKFYTKNLLYKGYTIQPYSPGAGTGLSTHELNMPGAYRDVTDTTVVAQFQVVRDDTSDFLWDDMEDRTDLYLLAWTTTPWTLPSNTALAVGPAINYVRIRTMNPYTGIPIRVILAESLISKWFDPAGEHGDFGGYKAGDKTVPWVREAEWKGSELDGVRYEQLLPYLQPDDGDAFRVLVDAFVTTEDGTGVVHLAPSFGADDRRVAQKYGIGSLTMVDKKGKFVEEAGEFAGRYVKDYQDEGDQFTAVDIDIAVKLKKENKAFNIQKYVHSYPHCWRTDKPILYYPLDSWFIRSTAMKERLVELNKTINWKPASTGEGRFGNWLENLQDWNLSRSRFWGIPLPIWRTADGSEEKCIGSIEELDKEIAVANESLGLEQSVPEDLHRPYIDEIVLVSESGEPMKRETDLIDVWFDSGSMPYAQWHYPFENEEKFKENYPADFISEGVDQTRGWFFTLHAIAGMLFDSVAFKNVISTGLVLDKNGQKMSKRHGNAIDPFKTLSEKGADATRWYMISNAQPWDNLKFDLAGIDEVSRKFFGTLYNTYSFFALYANIDKFKYEEPDMTWEERPEIDRWILSSLHTLTKEVDELFGAYEPMQAARKIMYFVDDQLSNWYVRLCRRRFWKGEYGADKIAAYQTLYECLTTTAKLIAPIAPFFGEWLYKNLNDVSQLEPYESVHLSLMPTVKEDQIDQALEERMGYAKRISSLGLSLRKKEQIRVRQPLQKIILPVLDPRFEAQVRAVEDLILAEINVKQIQYVTDTSGIIKKSIRPNFKTLGRRMGKNMKAAAALINQLGQEEIAEIEKSGGYQLQIDGEDYALTLEDFIIGSEDIEGWMVAKDDEITVALDIQLSSDLMAEGIARELVNRIQNLRKEAEYEVTDRIEVEMSRNATVLPAVEKFSAYIKEEVLADELIITENLEGQEVELIDGEKIKILLHKN
ncbi:isoleucine--tRNA ligase [Membranicola marinus]|uniref:Isoleucine--tRNA ligase n=1 Tax=Membranihabitans marinus TaxID=1227546 RepID=A0A953I240_9BACT|nr:isoleucine--tRNA ligase [Membranihabitans marinus]MBY5959867.1 isoleucine--tRNA ligase [Membranihabitans marinus]